jgi:hypothetical protein
MRTGARYQWLTHVILATQEAEIRRIAVGSQPGKLVHEILSQKTKQNKTTTTTKKHRKNDW